MQTIDPLETGGRNPIIVALESKGTEYVAIKKSLVNAIMGFDQTVPGMSLVEVVASWDWMYGPTLPMGLTTQMIVDDIPIHIKEIAHNRMIDFGERFTTYADDDDDYSESSP